MYPGLRYPGKKLKFVCKFFVFRNCLFEYKISFAVEKKNWGIFNFNWKTFFCRHQKNASHMEIV